MKIPLNTLRFVKRPTAGDKKIFIREDPTTSWNLAHILEHLCFDVEDVPRLIAELETVAKQFGASG